MTVRAVLRNRVLRLVVLTAACQVAHCLAGPARAVAQTPTTPLSSGSERQVLICRQVLIDFV